MRRSARTGELQRQVVRRAVLETRYHFNRLAPPFEGYRSRGHAARGAALLAQRTSGAGRLARHRQLPAEHARTSAVRSAARRRRAGIRDSDRYFDFVRTGNADRLEPVFEHNRLDLLSLAMMTARALQVLGRRTGAMHVGAGKPGRRQASSRGSGGSMTRSVVMQRDRSFARGARCRTRWQCARRCHAEPRASIPPQRAIHRGRRPVARARGRTRGVPDPAYARRSRRSRSISSTARETCRRRAASRACRWPSASAPAGWRQAVIGWRVWIGNWRNCPDLMSPGGSGRRRIATER